MCEIGKLFFSTQQQQRCICIWITSSVQRVGMRMHWVGFLIFKRTIAYRIALCLIWVLRLELLSECWSRRIEWVSSILIWQHCELTRMCYRLTFSLPCRACMQRVAAKVPEPVSCIEKFNSRLCSSFSCWLCVGITLENLCFVTFWWNSKCFK